jgi:glycosyltransferase involved in cell wall biosynthesis
MRNGPGSVLARSSSCRWATRLCEISSLPLKPMGFRESAPECLALGMSATPGIRGLGHRVGPTEKMRSHGELFGDACPNLWVVVPFLNEAAWIAPTLAALTAQRDRNFTLLLVDNGSTDGGTDVIRRSFSKLPTLRWCLIEESQKGTGAAADSGFRYAIAAGATHVARTDADCLPDPRWITAIRAGFASGAELVVGKIGPRLDEEPLRFGEATLLEVIVAAAATFGRLRPGNRDRRYLTGYVMAAGNNLAITSGLYLQCGGFPRTCIEEVHEDRALINAARIITSRIVRRHDMVVLNSLRRLRRWGLRRTLLWYWDHRWLPDEVDIR